MIILIQSLTQLKSQKILMISLHQNVQTFNKKSLPLRKLEKTKFWKLIIVLTSSDQIIDLIRNHKSSKSFGPCSISIKAMTISKEIIPLPLSQLINDSISKWSFSNICKLVQVIPIFKNDSRLLCTNYGQISLLSYIS